MPSKSIVDTSKVDFILNKVSADRIKKGTAFISDTSVDSDFSRNQQGLQLDTEDQNILIDAFQNDYRKDECLGAVLFGIQNLIKTIVYKGYANRVGINGFEFSDLVQTANVAAIQAITKYKQQKGKFTSYLSLAIRECIQKSLHAGDLVNIPYWHHRLAIRLPFIIEDIANEKNIDEADIAINDILSYIENAADCSKFKREIGNKLTGEMVKSLLNMKIEFSIDVMHNDNENSVDYGYNDDLTSYDNRFVSEDSEDMLNSEVARHIIENADLTNLQRDIVKRFYIDGETAREISADTFSKKGKKLTEQGVNSYRQNAVTKMKKQFENSNMSILLDM